MPSTPSRELTVTYGSFTFSPDGQYRLTEDWTTFTFEATFNITAASAAALQTACSSARTAFRKPFQDFSLAMNGTTFYSLKQSDNTGLEIKSEIIKDEHDVNTGISRRFTVRITGGLPANGLTTSGLRDVSVSVGYTPARRRRVTISGTFTAVTGSDARAAYTAAIDTFVGTVKSSLSITNWELVAEDPTAGSYNEKTLSFSRQYLEIKFPQAGSADDAAIVDQRVRITVAKRAMMAAPSGLTIPGAAMKGETFAPESSTGGRAVPLLEVSASYEAWLDFGQTTDLFGKWNSIKPWLTNLMRAAAGGGVFAITADEPGQEPDDNRLVCSLRGAAAPPGTTVLRREWSQSLSNQPGYTAVPVWDGNPTSCFIYKSPRMVRTTTRLVEEVVSGGVSGVDGSGGGGASSVQAPGGGGSGVTGWGGILTGAGGFSFGFADLGQALGLNSQNSGWETGGSGADPGGGLTPNKGSGGDDNHSMPPDSFVEQDETTPEPMEFGLDNPFTVTRTTRTRTIRYVTAVAQPKGYGART